MIGTRFTLAIALAVGADAPVVGLGDGGGLFGRKMRAEPARIRQLAEILRSEPDEKKRKAAVAELAEADPRVHPEIIPALAAALRKDASAAVRLDAAEAIGRYKIVFPTAGLALEDTLESDAAAAVRGAVKEALWEYHLLGYRSARGFAGFAGQTAEPPIAQPPRPAEPITSEPPTALAVAAVHTPTLAALPPVGPPPGPRASPAVTRPGSLLAVPPSLLNLTVEPPRAMPTAAQVSMPTATTEPPIRLRWPEPITVGKPPPLAVHLPSIVLDPGPIPGVTPFPEPTAEPPIRKVASTSSIPTPSLALPPDGK